MGWREDRFQRLLMLAGEICISTPAKQHKHSVYAQVPWEFIHELRQIVTDLGIDLDNARAIFKELEKKRKQKEAEERKQAALSLQYEREKEHAEVARHSGQRAKINKE